MQTWTDDANDQAMNIPDNEIDEQLLLKRLARGDRQSFWSIWMLYRNEFFSCCLRWMGGSIEEAEDALSSASLRAWRYLSTHDEDIANVKGWLLRLLYNHCMTIRKARKQQDRIIQILSTLPHSVSAWKPRGYESPEDIVSRQEILQDVHGAIGKLPPHLHDTVALRLVDHLSYREIATQLNLSPENARKRMQQARSILRMSLVGTEAAR